jgi:hypothetical protein
MLEVTVSALFSKPKTPTPPPVAPPPPTIQNSNTDVAAQQLQESLQRGRSATLLTGGQGLADTGETTKKKLLGA